MKRLFPYLAPYKTRMAVGFSIKVAGTLVELFLPVILTYILNSVIETQNIGAVILWGILMIVCAAVACICNVIANRMAAKVSMQFSEAVRRDLFRKTLALSAHDSDRFTVPSLESRITTDTYNVHGFVSMMQRMGVRAPILLIGGITISFILDAALALVMLFTVPFILGIILFIRMRGVPLYEKVQRSVDGMVRVVREDVEGIRVIKALSKNAFENERYDKVNKRLSKDERVAGVVMGSTHSLMTLLMNLGIAGVVALSALRVSRGESSPATVIAFMQYFTQISMAMMALSRIFVSYTKSSASALRIAEIVDTPDGYEVLSGCEVSSTGAHVSFDGVSFSYGGKGKHLSDISFSIGRGESLGIIGATGSGKSTLVRLLLRFYDADSGRILIDGRDIRSLSKSELTSRIGIALQNDFLYADTVLENIKFGREISDEEAMRAAKIAQASDFIEALSDGYHHMLAPRGANLSGGQRQRLLIARAIAREPEILILDDASSALDYKTDANLRRALSESLRSSTVITVAQRVSSVKGCDLILVLDHGRIIGMGRHEQLLESCTEYREISDSQMGGAILD